MTRLFDELAQFIWLLDQLSKRLTHVVVNNQEFKQGHASEVTAPIAPLANLDLDRIALGIDSLLGGWRNRGLVELGDPTRWQSEFLKQLRRGLIGLFARLA